MIFFTSLLSSLTIGNEYLFTSVLFLFIGLSIFSYSTIKNKDFNNMTKSIGVSFLILISFVISKYLSLSINPLLIAIGSIFILMSLLSWIQDFDKDKSYKHFQGLSLMFLCGSYLSIGS